VLRPEKGEQRRSHSIAIPGGKKVPWIFKRSRKEKEGGTWLSSNMMRRGVGEESEWHRGKKGMRSSLYNSCRGERRKWGGLHGLVEGRRARSMTWREGERSSTTQRRGRDFNLRRRKNSLVQGGNTLKKKNLLLQAGRGGGVRLALIKV